MEDPMEKEETKAGDRTKEETKPGSSMFEFCMSCCEKTKMAEQMKKMFENMECPADMTKMFEAFATKRS
jgi:hypothetical protein